MKPGRRVPRGRMRDPRVVDAMRAAMRAGKAGSAVLVENIEDIAPPEVRDAFEAFIDTVAAVEREECALVAQRQIDDEIRAYADEGALNVPASDTISARIASAIRARGDA